MSESPGFKFPASLSISLTILISAIAIIFLQIPQLNALKEKGTPATPADYRRDEELEQFRLALLQNMPAFGFDNLFADWTMLQFFQYFGDDEARAVTGYDLSLEYFKIVIDRDPRFRDAYNFLATSGSLYAAMPEQTDSLIEQGLQFVTPQVPDRSYYILRHKGINELLFLKDAQQEAIKSFTQAAQWASIYPDEESQYVAQLSWQTAQFLTENPASKTAQVGAWVMVLETVADERTQKIVIERIEDLGGKVLRNPDGTLRIEPPEED